MTVEYHLFKRKQFKVRRDKVLDALQRAEQRFRAAVLSAPNAMMLFNRQGEIVLANPQAESLFGYDRQAAGSPRENRRATQARKGRT